MLNGNLEVVNKWAPPNNAKINVASCNSTQILLATGGGNLFYLQVEESDIKLIRYPIFFLKKIFLKI